MRDSGLPLPADRTPLYAPPASWQGGKKFSALCRDDMDKSAVMRDARSEPDANLLETKEKQNNMPLRHDECGRSGVSIYRKETYR